MNETQLLKTTDVAKLLNIPRRRLTDMCLAGEIAHVRFGDKTIRFTPEQVQEFIESQSLPVTKKKGK